VSLHSSAVARELRAALRIMLHTVKPIFSLYPVYEKQPVVQPVGGLTTEVEQPAASRKQTFNRLSNQMNNRLNVC